MCRQTACQALAWAWSQPSTFSGAGERGGYDSDAKAVLTLRELQRWLALAVACYHGEIYETLGRTPAGSGPRRPPSRG